MTRARRRLVAPSRGSWVKPDGFAENGLFETRFGTTAEEAAAALEQVGYWRDRFANVYRRSSAASKKSCNREEDSRWLP